MWLPGPEVHKLDGCEKPFIRSCFRLCTPEETRAKRAGPRCGFPRRPEETIPCKAFIPGPQGLPFHSYSWLLDPSIFESRDQDSDYSSALTLQVHFPGGSVRKDSLGKAVQDSM